MMVSVNNNWDSIHCFLDSIYAINMILCVMGTNAMCYHIVTSIISIIVQAINLNMQQKIMNYPSVGFNFHKMLLDKRKVIYDVI